jgi:hypothetical protein
MLIIMSIIGFPENGGMIYSETSVTAYMITCRRSTKSKINRLMAWQDMQHT